MRGVEVENDTLRVRTSIVRARESGRKTDGERDFWKHYDRFIASLQSEISTSSLGDSSPLYGTLHRCTLPIAQARLGLNELESWTSLLSARSASNCRIISRDLFYHEVECIVYHHFVRATDRVGSLKNRLYTLNGDTLSSHDEITLGRNVILFLDTLPRNGHIKTVYIFACKCL